MIKNYISLYNAIKSKLKKVLLISFAFFYLILASGVFMNFHYCGGSVKKVSFYHVSDEEGCCGSEEKDSGCCSDKAAFIKVKDNHHSFGAVKLNPNFLKCCEVIQPELKISLCDSYAHYKQVDHDPPVFYDNPIYLKHKVFLI